MRWSAEKLRWVLLSGALLLAGVLAAIFGMANYRAGKIWQRILARNGVNLHRETDGFTYSQSNGKRTVFTLHAANAIPHGNNNYTLHDAVLILYTKDGHSDRIYGTQFEYDQEQGTARAVGEVHMDLSAPAAAGTHAGAVSGLSFTPGDESATDPALIHVRTSGLVYVRKLGQASTEEPAEFRYKGLTCTSRGAEFDSGKNVLRLLSDVQMTGELHEAPFTLTSTRADLDRTANTVDLLQPYLVSRERNARAAHALLHLRADGSIERGDGDGGVVLRAGTQTVSAPLLHGDFALENRPEHALFSGGVTFTDSNAQRPVQGAAKTVDLSFSDAGTLKTAVADGGVTFVVKEPANGAVLTRQMKAQKAIAGFATTAAAAKRSELRSLHMTGAAEFSGESAAARVQGGSPGLMRVVADDLTTTFSPAGGRSPQPQHMAGVGHTLLQQSGQDGAHQASTGDALQVSFAERLGGTGANGGQVLEVASAVQTGHVELRSWPAVKPATTGKDTKVAEPKAPVGPSAGPSTGHAQQTVFEGSTGTLTLTGGGNGRAEVEDGGTQLLAPTIVLHQGTGDGEASGGVLASTSGADGEPVTHVLAAHAALLHAANLAQFFGTDREPARLWQGGSQVQAASIVLDGAHHTLAARPESRAGTVQAVFTSARNPGSGSRSGDAASRPAKAAATGKRPFGTGANANGSKSAGAQPLAGDGPEASRDTAEIRAAAMDYNDAQHEATFGGGVLIRGTEGTIAGDHGAAFLQPTLERAAADKASADKASAQGRGMPAEAHGSSPASFGGSLERFVVLGDVRLNQPGRNGTGEQLTYTAPTESYVLTGTPAVPPRIRDAQQGVVTGETLLFGAADSSIVVAGTPAAGKQGKPTRVHTETDLKQQ